MAPPDYERHPANRHFSWQAARGPFRRLDDAQARSWNEDGFLVLERVFDDTDLKTVIEAIDPAEARVEAFLRSRPDGKAFIARADEISFVPHLVSRSEILREFCSRRVFQDLAHDVIGPDVRLYWDQAVYKKPGTPHEFPWHQDNGYTFVEPQQYLTCWVALTDVDEENGCPWIVPGLQRLGTLRHWMTDLGWECLREAPGARPVPAPAGSVIVFSSLTPHRTGPNSSERVRKAYIVQYAPDGARLIRDDGSTEPCDAPDRQFRILSGGEPVTGSDRRTR